MPNTAVTSELIIAITLAIKPVVAKFTYDGFDVGSRVTDTEYAAVATAAAQAAVDFLTAPSI